MNTQASLPEGSVLLVRIPFRDGKQIVANAEVVYNNPGAAWVSGFKASQTKTATFIEHGLGSIGEDPDS